MIGETLGHYKILEKLGAGGMGEVYRAEDTTLEREVALKVLPPGLAEDPERLERFEREAKTLASLDHPNIVTIHTVEQAEGVRFLTMQLVEGRPLSEVIPSGGMPLEEIFHLAVPLADALASAHDKGVIHRDLKPANIMVTNDGRAKVLDFGLAKLSPWSEVGASEAETLASPANLTRPGLAVGTVAYMSPEQALGRELDRRTDLFSFGVAVYEMATGRQPFQGEAPGSILNEIINAAPTPPSQLNPGLPDGLVRTLEKCLEKDPDLRYQSARDLMADLKRVQRDESSGVSALEPPVPPAASAEPTPGRRRFRWLIAAALAVGLVALGWWLLQGKTPEVSWPPPSFIPFTTDGGWKATPRLSSDGERVAYAWRGPTEDLDIYVKALGAGAEPFRLTDDPGEEVSPVWSPDGREIAFIRSTEVENSIYVVPSMGGRERKLTELMGPLPYPPSLSWSPDGRWIAFSEKDGTEHPSRIVALSLETRERRDLTSPPPGIGGDLSPAFSPDGERVAFVRRVEAHWGNNDIWTQSIEGGEARPVTEEHYVEIGSVSWTQDGEEILFSGPSETLGRASRVRVDGGIPEPVAGLGAGSAGVSVIDTRMVYRQARAAFANIWRVPGRRSTASERIPEKLIPSSSVDLQPAISPDGSQIAFGSFRSGVPAIWVVQSDGSQPTQLTGNDRQAGTPGWSPDGRQIVYDSMKSGNYDVWIVGAEGGVSRQLTFEPSDEGRPSWSRDGRWIYFGSDRTGIAQIWKMPADGGEPVQVTQGGGFYARESWDGRYLYYVRSLSPTGIWRVPVEGGEETEIVSGSVSQFWNWDVSRSGIYYLRTPARKTVLSSYAFGYRGTSALYFQDFATGKVSELLRREGVGSLECVSVSPDEQWILYTEIPAGESELILVENFR